MAKFELNFQDMINTIFMFDQGIEDYQLDQLKILLKYLDDQYTNKGTSIATDQEYDFIRSYVNSAAPNNKYSAVGSVPTFGEVELPIKMGGLVELQRDSSDLQRWVDQYELTNETMVITEKLDGMSVQLQMSEYNQVIQALTRGDGVMGQNITQHIKSVPLPSKTVNAIEPLFIRAELIVKQSNSDSFNESVTRWRGSPYKNLRNGIAGCMGKEDVIPQDVLQWVDVVAYEIMNSGLNKDQQLQTLQQLGFKTPKYQLTSNILNVNLTELTSNMINNSEYELDGIVIDVNDADVRDRIATEEFEPTYARKYKIATQALCAVVERVVWSESMHGYLKPRIQIQPIELDGTTITYATGFNGAFIRDNKIGPGAVIEIVRSGGVIPYVQSVITQAKEADMPSGYYEWTDTDVDIYLTSKTDEAKIGEMVHFFKSLNVDFIGAGNARLLVKHGMTISDVIKADINEICEAIGSVAIGTKIHDNIASRFAQSMYEYELAGATLYLGRGVGVRKLKALAEAYPTISFHELIQDANLIETVDGFAETTADAIERGAAQYIDFYNSIKDNVVLKQVQKLSGDLVGKSFVFTQVRSKDAETEIINRGGKVGSSVSKNTTYLITNDIAATTGKAQKAIQSGVPIITLDELWEFLKGQL